MPGLKMDYFCGRKPYVKFKPSEVGWLESCVGVAGVTCLRIEVWLTFKFCGLPRHVDSLNSRNNRIEHQHFASIRAAAPLSLLTSLFHISNSFVVEVFSYKLCHRTRKISEIITHRLRLPPLIKQLTTKQLKKKFLSHRGS